MGEAFGVGIGVGAGVGPRLIIGPKLRGRWCWAQLQLGARVRKVRVRSRGAPVRAWKRVGSG